MSKVLLEKDGRDFELDTETKSITPLGVKESIPGGLAKAAGQGLMQGAEGNLQLMENLAQLASLVTPEVQIPGTGQVIGGRQRLTRGQQLVSAAGGPVANLGMLASGQIDLAPKQQLAAGQAADRTAEAREQLLPEGDVSGSIAGGVARGLGRLPGFIAEFTSAGRVVEPIAVGASAWLKGLGLAAKEGKPISVAAQQALARRAANAPSIMTRATPFALLGAIEGSEQGPAEAAIGALKGQAVGTALGLISPLNIVPRSMLGGTLFGAATLASGGTKEEAASEFILGMGLMAPSKNVKGEFKEFGSSIKNAPKAALQLIRNSRKGVARLRNLLRRSKGDPRIPIMERAKNDIKSQQEKLNELDAVATRHENEVLDRINKEFEITVGKIDAELGVSKAETKSKLQKIRTDTVIETARLKQLIKKTDPELGQEADLSSLVFQEKFSKWITNNGETYGKRLDKIAEVIDNARVPITTGAYSGVINRTLEIARTEGGITEGPAIDFLTGLQKKYQVREIETKPTGTTELVGQKRTTRSNSDDPIPFSEVRQDMKKLSNMVKSFKSPGRFNIEEIPNAIYHSEVGEFLAIKNKEFAVMQKEYRPVISYMNRLARIVKQNAGPAFSDQAATLIESQSRGGKSGAFFTMRRVLNFVEQGTKNFGETGIEGIGMISAKARQIGSNLNKFKQDLTRLGVDEASNLLRVAEEGVKQISELTQKRDYTKEQLTQKLDVVQRQLLIEKARTEMKISLRKQQLEKGEFRGLEKLKLLQLKGEKLNRIYKGIAFGIGGLGGGSYLVSRLARGAGTTFDFLDE